MFWCSIGVLAVAVLWVLPAQLGAFVVPSTGCLHNGTWYADKSLVPTMEKCLNCQCNRKSLVCRLKVCPEMPMPPPRGCVVVQKKHACCPYLSCARLDVFYKIPTKRRIIAYLDHYERESIDRVVNENMLQRRSDDSEVDLYVCVKNGTVYKSGSAMSSSNLCTYCYCIGGSEKCVKPKCMLPVEGCKPIFVDSTCCPVRYDCSTKPSGKSSQEVRYRKTGNKHFLRMSQRLQRHHGCTVGKQFYAEGQKMKSDEDKPCELCFCIRGTRRCAPKKCSPALKNCIPVVPKGQCCPSSYDCGSQRDYSRRQNSRQFNLYSLLFGKDESNKLRAPESGDYYPHDRHPGVTALHEIYNKPNNTHDVAEAVLTTTPSEKSIFDTIREGLEFIDGNNKQMLTNNMDLVELASKNAERTSLRPPLPKSSTTEVSLLDLLLGPSEVPEALNIEADNVKEEMMQEKTTSKYEEPSWVDLLLGPDEEEQKYSTLAEPDASTFTTAYTERYTSIDRLDNDFDDFSGSGEITVGDATSGELSTTNDTKFEEESTTQLSTTLEDTTDISSTIMTETVQTTIDEDFTTQVTTTERPTTTTTSSAPTTTKTSTTTAATTTTKVVVSLKPEKEMPVKKIQVEEKLEKTENLPLKEHKPSEKNQTAITSDKNNGLLSALIDGFTDILNAEKKANKTVVRKPTKSTTIKPPIQAIILPTPKPLPLFKPIPTVKPHTRINSKIANLTLKIPVVAIKHAPKPYNATIKKQNIITTTLKPVTTTIKANTSTKTNPTLPSKINTEPLKTTTAQPLVIKTNPTILEAEPLDNNAEPTLPPSLPNLKIIPFLPTDAVKAERTKPYEFYSSNPQTSRIDYGLYDDPNLYPSITERYPTYPDVDDSAKAQYIYKFKVEGPEGVGTSTATKLDDVKVTGNTYVKFDFVEEDPKKKGFSPPTKTEGGFVPKEPLIIDEEATLQMENELMKNNYQVTKHIIDITTPEPSRENTTKIIEITTPDPFKDVIRTEPPPDLTSLIEDKEKVLIVQPNSNLPEQTAHKIKKPHHVDSNAGLTTDRPKRVNSNGGALNSTTIADMLLEDRNSIEAFLDILLKEDENEEHLRERITVTSTAIPPFKSLPAETILATQLLSTVTPANPTRPKNATETPTTSATTKAITTTKAPKQQKQKPSSTRRPAPSATRETSPKPIPTSRTTTAAATITSTRPQTTRRSATTTLNPFLMSPFDKLPFMDASFEVKLTTAAPPSSAPTYSNLLGLVHYKNSLTQFEGLAPAYESFAKTPAVHSSVATATARATTTHSPSASTNNLIDPTGLLKLAGCNIYGRMYRVGRIILELSGPCKECKCTEVGVECGSLDC